MAEYEVQGKNFLITGGASGLGAKYVEKLLDLGAKNVAILDVAVDVGQELAERLSKTYPGQVIFIKCDVSKEEDIAKAFDEVVSKFKQIDVIVNNAGIMVDSEEMWRVACDVNWQGLVSFTMKGIRHMSKAEGGVGGTIINISSMVALVKVPFLPVYCGSKMAVLHFSQSLAMDPFYEQTGIRILTMCFGPTDTPLLQGLDKRSYNPVMGKIMAMENPDSSKFQKISSAVDAFVLMYKSGSPGSIWYSSNDRPGMDVTEHIDAAFDSFGKFIQ